MGFAPNVRRAGWAPRPGGCEGAGEECQALGKVTPHRTLRAQDPVPQPQPDPVGQEASTELPQGGGGPRVEESPPQSPRPLTSRTCIHLAGRCREPCPGPAGSPGPSGLKKTPHLLTPHSRSDDTCGCYVAPKYTYILQHEGSHEKEVSCVEGM